MKNVAKTSTKQGLRSNDHSGSWNPVQRPTSINGADCCASSGSRQAAALAQRFLEKKKRRALNPTQAPAINHRLHTPADYNVFSECLLRQETKRNHFHVSGNLEEGPLGLLELLQLLELGLCRLVIHKLFS